MLEKLGGCTRIRTLDPLIKSQLLCVCVGRLPWTMVECKPHPINYGPERAEATLFEAGAEFRYSAYPALTEIGHLLACDAQSLLSH